METTYPKVITNIYSIHSYVGRKFGKPKLCEHCGKTKGSFEWSNKDHKYSRDRRDWERLCKSCHMKYDFKQGFRKGTLKEDFDDEDEED